LVLFIAKLLVLDAQRHWDTARHGWYPKDRMYEEEQNEGFHAFSGLAPNVLDRAVSRCG
jgi:hypothetical protein